MGALVRSLGGAIIWGPWERGDKTGRPNRHAAVTKFIPKPMLERAWGCGHVDIRRPNGDAVGYAMKSAIGYAMKESLTEEGATGRVESVESNLGLPVRRNPHFYSCSQGMARWECEHVWCADVASFEGLARSHAARTGLQVRRLWIGDEEFQSWALGPP